MIELIRPVSTSLSLLAAAICLVSTGVQAETIALEEIVVTAQKREQNLQDVPVAITAFTGDQLKEAVIKDVFDLQTNTPGLRVRQSQSNTTANFSIRGVGTSSQNFGLESSVGLYVDGVYRSRQSTMINDMIDMEAVEVLRGPQGTLFGKNTPSGALLFRTQAPSHETNGFASITGGNYNLVNASAGGNLSLIEDELAVRGTVFSSKRDGYIDVDGFGDDVLNDRDRWGTRLQALWEPNEDLSIKVIADYSEIDEICCGALTYVDSLVAKERTNAGAPIPGTDAVLQALGGTVVVGDQTDSYETTLNILPESQAKDRGLSVDVSWIRDNYTYTSITSYRKYNSRDIIDSDFSDVSLITTENDANQSSFSQEFRIDYSGDNFNAVVGAYYFSQEVELDYTLTGGDMLDPYAGAAFGLSDFVNGMAATSVATGGIIPLPATAFPADFVANHVADQEQDSWAIFGQFDYNFTDQLIVTAGLRYTEENKELSTTFSETIGGVTWVPGAPTTLTDVAIAGAGLAALAGGDLSGLADPAFIAQFDPYTTAGWGGYLFAGFSPIDDINAKLDDDQITGTLKLTWLATEDTMLYASYGTGYKSGGTNTDRLAEGFEPVFGPETSESFELGVKSEFPDQAVRINAAIHHTTVDDFQANAFTGTGFNLQNAGKLKTYGGELEAYWQPAQNTVVTLAYAYSVADFDEFTAGNCWVAYPFHTGTADPGATAGSAACDRSGDRLADNPEHYANLGVKQSFNVSDGVEGYVYGEYAYLSDQVLDGNNDPYKLQDDFGLLNMRAGIFFEEYELNLTLWARNVLDEDYKRTTFDVPVQDGKLMSYAGEPRTYGLTLNKDF